MNAARLLFPAVRWHAEHGFAEARAPIDQALDLGVGGFIIFGGEAGAVQTLTRDLQKRSKHPLLIGADLERGAGQQFKGATPLPPLAAIGSLNDLDITRRAGELTAREARALGINWVYAPDADVDVEPRNPIIGTRSFGTDAEHVARHVIAWITGCHHGGALACAKHFPGHGRTTTDSHAELPVVAANRATLMRDLEPFQAAIRAGVDSVMSAHISFPALDPSGRAATLSPAILTNLLREQLGFRGLIVTDALIMEGVLGAGEAAAVVDALHAGCDALLYPTDLQLVAGALQSALSQEGVRERVEQSIARIDAAAAGLGAGAEGYGLPRDRDFALDVALRTMHGVRGDARVHRRLNIMTVDDDLGGPYPTPPRTVFPDTLTTLGFTVDSHDLMEPATRMGELVPDTRTLRVRGSNDPRTGWQSTVVAVYCDIRAWKGRSGLSDVSRARVREAVDEGAELVVLFGHPRLAKDLAGDHVLSAWGGEALMQEAAAHWLAQHAVP